MRFLFGNHAEIIVRLTSVTTCIQVQINIFYLFKLNWY